MMSKQEVIYDSYPVKRWGYANGRHPTGYRQLREVLLRRYSECYHCGRTVKEYPDRTDGMSNPDDMATIDHLKPRQWRTKHELTEKVISCYACNSRLNYLVQSGKLLEDEI